MTAVPIDATRGFHTGSGATIEDVLLDGSDFMPQIPMRFSSVCLIALLLVSCTATAPPHLPELEPQLDGLTIVLVPGVSGTKLRDRNTGEIAWGDTASFFGPRDGGYELALPITRDADALEPFDVIQEVRLLTYKKEAYGSVVRLMERHRLRLRFFLYDWRRDNVDAARRLARELLSSGAVRTALICQSNAAQICRYAVRFGDVPLEEAERGVTRAPRVEKIILVGTSNGGAIRILQELHRGRRYVNPFGRKFQPETLFTFRSLFQDLPVYTASPDLFDTATWKRHGWSIYRADASQRTARRPDLFGSEDDRDAYLRRMLDGSKRLHALLRSDAGATPLPRFYSIQSRAFLTPDRAVLRDGRLEFTRVEGDYHATVASQQFLSAAETASMARAPVYVAARHFEIITRPEAHRAIVEILGE